MTADVLFSLFVGVCVFRIAHLLLFPPKPEVVVETQVVERIVEVEPVG